MISGPDRFPARVLMTTDTVGGVWTYSIELARELARKGVEVLLAAMGGPLTADQRAQVRMAHGVSVIPSEYKLEWMQDPWGDVVRSGEWLLRLETEFGPDVIHLNGYCHGALPWRHPVLMVAHSCVLSWWAAVRGTALPREWDRYEQQVRAGLGAASVRNRKDADQAPAVVPRTARARQK